MAAEAWSPVPTDALVEILARVDGVTLASAACVCTALREAAKEEALWEELCRGAWPSTTESTARKLVSSMPGGFAKFYADALPLLLYEPHCRRGSIRRDGTAGSCSSPPGLVSLVDVYYKNRYVLSRVLPPGVPLHDPPACSCRSPFKLEALGAIAADVGGDETGAAPSIALEPKEEGGVGVLNWTLEEDLTLSWVVVDVERGRAVNVSGGRPTVVQRDWPAKGDLAVRFCSAVPVDRQLLTSGAAECVISMCCRLSEAEDQLSCTAIELEVKDAEGVPVDWRRGWEVLDRALYYEKRTRNEAAAAGRHRAYMKDRKEMMEKGVAGRRAAENLCALTGVVLLVGCCILLL